MTKRITKNVYQIIGTDTCAFSSDGDKVYDVIFNFLKEKHPITLSFLNIQIVTVSFLNNAIGKLYKDFSEEEIKKYLEITNLDDEALLNKVVLNAKFYYENPKSLEDSIKK